MNSNKHLDGAWLKFYNSNSGDAAINKSKYELSCTEITMCSNGGSCDYRNYCLRYPGNYPEELRDDFVFKLQDHVNKTCFLLNYRA